MIKNGEIKIKGVKYLLNYNPRELGEKSEAFMQAVQSKRVRSVTSYFSEACLNSKKLRNDPNSFNDLVRWYERKRNQLISMGKTYLFDKQIVAAIRHKGETRVRNSYTELEKDLLNYMIRKNVKHDYFFVKFTDGYILKINKHGETDVLFDFESNIRDY